MSERQTILPEPCSNFCKVEQAAHDAIDRYAEQLNRIKTIESLSSGILPERKGREAQSELIRDPQFAIDHLQEQLKSRPCDFLKSGQCGASAFLVETALNMKLNG